jgi:alpha-L-fucosidase 2
MHLWQHYIYNLDTDFLRNKAYPVMKSACEYWLGKLVKNATDGTWEAPNGWSPEQNTNPRFSNGTPYDQQLIWNLFHKTLKTIDIIGEPNTAFVDNLREKFNNLDIGLHVDQGRIKEWKNIAGSGGDDSHRHISHLIALFPGDQITAYYPEAKYIEGAKGTLNQRGDGGTGWSRAWKISTWARLLDGERAYKLLKMALNYSTSTGVSTVDANGGTYQNLLCSHPPFQIDGNFWATAGIAEMLIQSHKRDANDKVYIDVLPALPDAWASGSFKGLKAQGNFTVDLVWAGKQVTACMVYSGSGGNCIVRFGNKQVPLQTAPGGRYLVSF